MSALLSTLLSASSLDEPLAEALLDTLTSDAPDALKGALLAALAARPVTGPTLRALALGMRRRAVPVVCPEGAVDTCGTGGDGSGSFNVSTATALLLAADGVPVVKHGNRAVSGPCGSADVLEALGVPLDQDPAAAAASLASFRFTFLFAPAFHPATRAIGPVRRALGVRTAFNLLGPLTNPAAPRHQLIGAATPEAAEQIALALSELPIERCFVVHGAPSWDEATPCGSFLRWDVRPGHTALREIDPRFTYGMTQHPPESLAGGDATHNARLLHGLFQGVRGGIRDAVLLNAALVYELLDPSLSARQALERATATLDEGRAAWLLDRLARPGA